MAKKHADTVIDLGAELKKRIKQIVVELTTLQLDLRGCINEKAHLKQYYTGRIEQAGKELAFLKGLVDA